MLAKCLVLMVLGYIFKLRGADKWLFALGLAQAGEFGFVLLSFTVANSILPQAVADQLLLVIALSMLLTPLLFILYDRVIVPRYASSEIREADEIEEPSQIIIAGAGRVGGIVNRMLKSAGYTPTIIDFNSSHLEALRTFGVKVYYGDATRPDLLAAAGIADAKLFVIAIDNKEQITELVRYATSTYPNLHVMARARNRHHVYELWAAGCRDIVRETYDASLRMGRSAFEALGASKKASERMKDLFNETDREAMISVADAYDPNIPAHENEAYVARIREVLETRQAELTVKMGKIRKEEDAKRETTA